MPHHLILLLGKGQPTLTQDKKLQYRQANYHLPGVPEKIIQTPFVGEAILELYKEDRIDQVHILGTRDSMWSTLYGHCVADGLTEVHLRQFEDIDLAIREKSGLSDDMLAIIREAFQLKSGVETHCHIIPVGKNEGEIWDFFKTVVNLVEDRDTISIDITHGLRYQPFILFLALSYLKLVKEKVKWGRTFYGAFELSNDYFEGNTPVFDLGPILSMMEWSYAAQAFQRYGDMGPINQLLGANKHAQLFVEKAKAFNLSLQFYEVDQIREKALSFVKQLKQLEKNPSIDQAPFSLVQQKLAAFPNLLIETSEEWQMLLRIAERHLRNEGEMGLAILATWEAIISRLASIYGLDKTAYHVHTSLSKIARAWNWKKRGMPIYLLDFPRKCRSLSQFRNSIAHVSQEENVSTSTIDQEFPKLFFFFKGILGNEGLRDLPYQIPFTTT